MEYVCSNFNLRLVKTGGTDEIINIGDKMLAEPSLSQTHSTELVSFARSEYQQAFHYGGIGHELIVSRYFGPYTDLTGSEVNALTQSESNASKAKFGYLTVEIDGASGRTFKMHDAVLSSVNVYQGQEYKKGFVMEYSFRFGDMEDITP